MDTNQIIKLNEVNLPHFSQTIPTPQYDRSSISPGMVHIGVRGFHRAHQAIYLDDYFHVHSNSLEEKC